MRSNVDLPEPLRRIKQIRSPAATAKVAPESSGVTPKVRLMSWSRSSGGGMGGYGSGCFDGTARDRLRNRRCSIRQFSRDGRSRAYSLAIAIFCNEVKGKSMLAMSRDLGVQYKTSFVLAHKMREAMASEVRQTSIGGDGKRAEIDGGYFGGYVKPANRRENRRDRRLRQNQSGKRKVVVVIRERDGRTLPGVFHSEVEALSFIRRQVPRGTQLLRR